MDVQPNKTLNESARNIQSQAWEVDRATHRGVARIPSSIFFWSAVASVCISAVLRLMGRKNDAVFVGEWPPTLMAAAIFTRLAEDRRR
jgi:hypothetical protein